MQVHTFIAESAAQAVEQIRQQLGPHAVVLNVRKLPAEGLARLWQKPRIEVLACVPELPTPTEPAPDPLAELRQELAQIKEQVQQRHLPPALTPSPRGAGTARSPLSSAENTEVGDRAVPAPLRPEQLPLAKLLESSGLLPVHAQQVLDQVHGAGASPAPQSLADELRLARAALIRFWRPQQPASSNLHLFIGPPGVGKTTVLCKWLAQAVLVEGRRARVWRLDGHVANTAESLSVFAEILGVPVERFRPDHQLPEPSEMVFVDLPGVNWSDGAALQDLGRRLASFPEREVHLVLNAAYEGQLLLAQGRAFSSLPIHNVILTHLDEEPRWGKLWNFLLGTNFTIAYLSAGQNIPGDFHTADPERILARQFPQK